MFPKVNAGIINSPQTLCYNAIADTIGITQFPTGGGDIAYTYQWQYSSNATVWNNISGATDTIYSAGNLINSIYYRIQTTSSYGCGPRTSDSIYIHVYNPLIQE